MGDDDRVVLRSTIAGPALSAAVLTVPYGARTKLAAPRATLGIGDRSVDAARDLVEHRWLLHRGEAVEPTHPTQPTTVAHEDLWPPPPA